MNDGWRRRFGDYLSRAETLIYVLLAVLLAVTALVLIGGAWLTLWRGIGQGSLAEQPLQILDEMLVVMMLVEVLHTVRISIRSHMLAMTEPFLVVGLIATIRRILVITLEAAKLGKEGEGAVAVLRASLVELGLLGGLVLIFVVAIVLLRRFAPTTDPPKEV
jgi:hypothetical protein